jgi:hypothetical protein
MGMVVLQSIAYADGRVKKATSKKTKPKAKPKKATAKKAVASTKAKLKKKAAAVKKRVAAPKKKKAAAAPKKKAAAAPKKKAAAAPKKKAAAAPKKKAAAAPKKKAAAKKTAAPSPHAVEVAMPLPQERALTDEERDAMAKVAHTALAALETDGQPELIVASIAAFVDDIRGGIRPEPNSQDVRLGLGVLWGEQVRAQVGWRWVHLSYANGFASYALVPDDRAFACFPLNRLAELMRPGAEGANTSVPLFDSIRIGTLPARRENAYLVIG